MAKSDPDQPRQPGLSFPGDSSDLPAEIKELRRENARLRNPAGNPVALAGLITDISAGKQAEEEQLAHLYFLQALEMVDHAMRQDSDLDQMLKRVLGAIFEIFGSDRVWLLHPCDPGAASFRVPMEITRPGFPGALELNQEVAITPASARILREALATEGPVTYGAGNQQPMSPDMEELFAVRTQMIMAIYPKFGQPWLFGMHQCSHARVWTEQEKKLFKEIGRRISDGLNSLLLLRDLRESNDRYQLLIETMNEGLVQMDENVILTFTNQRLGEMLAYSQVEMTGRRLTAFLDQANKKILFKQLARQKKGGHAPYEMQWTRRDGTPLATLMSPKPIFDKQGRFKGSFAVITDITGQKQAEQEKARLEGQLIQAQKLEAIGTLAGGLAHDFNNMLTAVLGNIDLAQLHLQPDEKISGFLRNARQASEQAHGLTQQLLTFSKGGEPVKETFAIEALVRDSAMLVLSGSKVKCEYRFSGDLRPVDADRQQIKQVIHNILLNAVQSMPTGGVITMAADNVHIDPDVPIPLPDGNYTRISVIDQGIGIPEKYLARIFDPYFSTKQAGTGLGLAISHSIVSKHGGHLVVESEPGTGSTFSLYLPASDQETPASNSSRTEPVRGRGRVLVMDDEEHVREVVTTMLTYLGYESRTARHGDQALELYKKAKESGHPFDAVILDLTIPGGKGGVQAIRELLAFDPQVKAIVSSGYSNDPVMADYRSHGFSGIAAKPYKVGELSVTLRDVLRG